MLAWLLRRIPEPRVVGLWTVGLSPGVERRHARAESVFRIAKHFAKRLAKHFAKRIAKRLV